MYGGGKVGLMGVMVDIVIVNGGYIIGVILIFLRDCEIVYENLLEFIIVNNMFECKVKMMLFGDVFIVLFGGFGIFEEIFEVIFWFCIG